MTIVCYEPTGFDGEIVSVEIDLRRGIPAIDLVGLPDGAVKESRERVRAAIRNSGFEFPLERILINLAPAGVRKEGAGFDLPIAVGILAASGEAPNLPGREFMILGELELSGRVRPVRGVLSAISSGLNKGVDGFMVPRENESEARALGKGEVFGVSSLSECVHIFTLISEGRTQYAEPSRIPSTRDRQTSLVLQGGIDYASLKGQERVKRAMEIAAAGGHNLLVFGPPGSGKTMAVRALPSILPDLSPEDSVVVTRIHSLAGCLPPDSGLIFRPPFRAPHHGASAEGIIGGGRTIRPGEISLAHKGVLFLDEAPEFKKNILQNLREPIEEGRIVISRASISYWLPADFQLVLAANPCPCGNSGREGRTCVCSIREISAYWKKLGGALLDRIDLRVPVLPTEPERMIMGSEEPSSLIKKRVSAAKKIQEERFEGQAFNINSRIPVSSIQSSCMLDGKAKTAYTKAIDKLGFSSRASLSILKTARTIADLEASEVILPHHIFEAVGHRKAGDEWGGWDLLA